MAKAHMGAYVVYCGHAGVFVADIFEVAGANVVRANGPITADNLDRRPSSLAGATHHVSDVPRKGPATNFWRPDLGVLVVPADQVTETDAGKRRRS